MTILERYVTKVTELYCRTHPGVDLNSVKKLVDEFVLKSFKDIPCHMKNNVTHEDFFTTVCEVTNWIEQSQPIITGNATFFRQHAQMKSPDIIFLESLMARRDSIKKQMFTKPEGSPEYLNLYTGQGNVKVIMNSDYGGSGTPFSPFYSVFIPAATTSTAKNMTTTLICCLEFAFGNNNRWVKLKDINELFDMINIVLSDTKEREIIDDTYTVDEVLKYLMDRVITFTPDDVNIVRKFLYTLTDIELTKLMLSNNMRLVINKYLQGEFKLLSDYMKSHQLDLDSNMTKDSLYVAGFGAKAPEELTPTFEHVKKVLCDNCCYPFILNDAETRASEMKRRVVCVTDTDSLMVHFSNCVDDFQTRVSSFRDSCLMATAIGLRLFSDATGIIATMVNYIALGYNIHDEYYRKKFIFKNEFGFLAMALFAKKMYASSCFVQEGNPRNIHKIAISGMSFKKRDAAEFLEPIMTKMYDVDILTTKQIRVETILDKYYELRAILDANLETDTSYYQVMGLKEVGAYDASKVLPAALRGALIWNSLNPDEEMQPMDRVIVIKLSWDKMEMNSSNPTIAQMLKNNKYLYMANGALANGAMALRNGIVIDNESMKSEPVICIPENYTEIPDYIRCCIDKESIRDTLLSPCKQILGLFDVYMADTKSGMIASRMISI